MITFASIKITPTQYKVCIATVPNIAPVFILSSTNTACWRHQVDVTAERN